MNATQPSLIFTQRAREIYFALLLSLSLFFTKQSTNYNKYTLNALLTVMPLCRTKPEAVDVTFAGETIASDNHF